MSFHALFTRPFDRTDRGVSEILGLLFAFGLVVSVIAVVQLAGTPVWTAGDEADHQHRVQTDLTSLDGAVFRTAGIDPTGSVAVETDTTYPERYLVVSPPEATGTFTTTDSGTVTLSNVTAVGNEAAYWNNSTHVFGNATTLVYSPDYTERESQSLVIESGVSYLDADGETVVHRQSLVHGTTVTLVVLEGDLDGHTTAGETIKLSAVSVRSEPLPVVDDGTPIRISVPTRLDESDWSDLLASEPYAAVVTGDPDGDPSTVTIELVSGKTYDLRIARISVGTAVEPTPATYLVTDSGDYESVPVNGSQTLVVRVFDEYGAPVAGEEVDFTTTTPLGGNVTPLDGPVAVTDESGRAYLSYRAPSDVVHIKRDTVDVSLPNSSAPGNTTTIPLEVRGSTEPARFTISGGSVVAETDFGGDFDVIGSAIKDGDGNDIPVDITLKVGGKSHQPWANINDGQNHTFAAVGADSDAISITAKAEFDGGFTVRSHDTDDSDQVLVLRDGDDVPTVEGYNGQEDAAEFLEPYIGDDGSITLDDNQAIFLFELGTTDETSPAFDRQDAVILVTLWNTE
ncbi:hypothetical protein [Haloferax profundi]|uniref:Big-1 domain-containing protein n=1 Tax=Haloferax profundi TaxID=1544718 RepID=A0A0W1SPZ8_9EURY|nr:hypothetical protein [Haloferax profundi]KTG28403.1 hypothetical protein AUR66_11910 [Haloferax profundi]